MATRFKTSDERRMLILKGKQLTLKGKDASNRDEAEKVKAEIDALRRKGVK